MSQTFVVVALGIAMIIGLVLRFGVMCEEDE